MIMSRCCAGRLLLPIVAPLVYVAFAERVQQWARPGVPGEYDETIPTNAVLVSEKLVSPCQGYPFPPNDRIADNYCFAEALEKVAHAVNIAGGVELWVAVSERTFASQEQFLQYFQDQDRGPSILHLHSLNWLVFIPSDLGAAHVWVRDWAPTLSIDGFGRPNKLLMLPYKKFVSNSDMGRVGEREQAIALGMRISDEIGILNQDTINTPTFVELPPDSQCFFDWGNFETDGAGVCLTTNWETRKTHCKKLQAFLAEHAGCVYFPEELVPLPEQTKHVDVFARFVDSRQLLMAKYDGKEERRTCSTQGVNAACTDGSVSTLVYAEQVMNQNHGADDLFVASLDDLNDKRRADWRISALPTPKGIYKSPFGHRDDVLISYANVLMIQGEERVLLFPTFGDELKGLVIPQKGNYKQKDTEQEARETWMKKLGIKQENVIDIRVDSMMAAGGGPHCMTKQYQFIKGEGQGS